MEHSERSIEEGHRTEFIGGEGEQLRGVKRPGTGNRSKPRPIESSKLNSGSCEYCYRRKIKCDKRFPCQNCLRRGLGDDCHPPEVQVRGQTTGGPSQRRALGMEELRVENAALHRRVAKQERLLKTLEIQMSREKGAEELNADDDMSDDEYANPECPLDLEYILQYETEEHARSAFSYDSSSTEMQHIISMVPWSESMELVMYHFEHLSWLHATINQAIYLDWHTRFTAGFTADRDDPGALALYFSIIATALYFMSPSRASGAGFDEARRNISVTAWGIAGMRCVELSFRAKPNLSTLRAICVLPFVAHPLGYEHDCLSSRMRLFHNTALLLAQENGLHVLKHEDFSVASTPGRVDRETRRRIWNCLVVDQCLSVAVMKGYTLLYPKSEFGYPTNVNDRNVSDEHPHLVPPADELTNVSHLIAMRKLAHVIYDYNHRVNLSPTSGARLVAVQELDTHLATLLDFCPLLKWSDSENTPAFHSTYLYWARFTWAWRIPAYRMKLHSIFIGLGRRDDRFRASEDICKDCATEMLNLGNGNLIPRNCRKDWRMTLDFTFLGYVLHRLLIQENETAMRTGYLANLVSIRDMFNHQDPLDSAAKRGSDFLTKLINNVPLPDTSPPVPNNAWDATIFNGGDVFDDSAWTWHGSPHGDLGDLFTSIFDAADSAGPPLAYDSTRVLNYNADPPTKEQSTSDYAEWIQWPAVTQQDRDLR